MGLPYPALGLPSLAMDIFSTGLHMASVKTGSIEGLFYVVPSEKTSFEHLLWYIQTESHIFITKLKHILVNLM